MTVSTAVAYFDQVAQEYARRYQAQTPGGYALRVRRQRVLEFLEGSGGKVLDVGCGPGPIAEELLDRGYQYWGVDAAPGMIEQARQRFEQSDWARFIVGDATHLAFPDGFFDSVMCVGVIDRIPAYERALKEMARVTRRGGTLVVSFPNLLSPYATWKNFVFYPTVALLRPVYRRLTGRRQPPALPASCAKLYTAQRAAHLLARYGAEVTDVVYYNFNVFLSPLDELFPRWAMHTAERLERLRSGSMRWLGTGFLLKAKKHA